MSAASSGHQLGQLVGDWFEENVAVFLLNEVAMRLNLYLDHRFKERECRGAKILWSDLDGNEVDYDFVLELRGTDKLKGIPLAFFETFWRRGSRHSKDKARDDSGKLMPMRITYPTARVLGIISAGDFTRPAQELVNSRGIDLFYIPKNEIVEAWRQAGVEMDYSDSADENEKAALVAKTSSLLNKDKFKEIFDNLYSGNREAIFKSYIQRIIANISALPIQFEVCTVYVSEPLIFSSHEDVQKYLNGETDKHSITEMHKTVSFKVIFSDGNIFERSELSAREALELNEAVNSVSQHFTSLSDKDN